MPKHLHFDGKQFAYWSTVVDAYVTYPGTEEDVRREAEAKESAEYRKVALDSHIQRAKDYGCSAFRPFTCPQIEPFLDESANT